MSAPHDSNPKKKVLYKQQPSERPRRNISPTQLKRREEALNRAHKTSLLMRWKNSDSAFWRAMYKLFNGIWVAVVAVGSFIAWLISFLLM